MDGWWTVTASEGAMYVCLEPEAVLMDRSPDPPAAAATAGGSGRSATFEALQCRVCAARI